jgi:hypothetical protein
MRGYGERGSDTDRQSESSCRRLGRNRERDPRPSSGSGRSRSALPSSLRRVQARLPVFRSQSSMSTDASSFGSVGRAPAALSGAECLRSCRADHRAAPLPDAADVRRFEPPDQWHRRVHPSCVAAAREHCKAGLSGWLLTPVQRLGRRLITGLTRLARSARRASPGQPAARPVNCSRPCAAHHHGGSSVAAESVSGRRAGV